MVWATTEGDGLTWLVALAASVLLLWICRKLPLKPRSSSEFPRCPPGFPILGNCMLLNGSAHELLSYLAWNQGYGDLFGLWLGSIPTVVVTSADLAKEVLHMNDKILANRGSYLFLKDLYYGYNQGIIFSSYNPRWVWRRKIFSLELLTLKRMQELQAIRYAELRKLLKRLQDSMDMGARPVDVGQQVYGMTANTTLLLLQSRPLEKAIIEPPELVHILDDESLPAIGDFVPWLSFLDFFNSRRRWHAHRRIDALMESILGERRRLMAHCSPDELPHDFLQVLLSKEGASDEEHLTTTEIKAVILDMFAGAVHTSATMVEWAMAELLRHPECMRRLQEEVDSVMALRCNGVDSVDLVVNDDHVQEMPYLHNILKEVLRLHPILPLLLPRVASTGFRLGKYWLPPGTNVLVNAWAIARDPRYWTRPTEFWPDRFLEVEIDLHGQDYEYLPFGSGRRVCPGMRLGMSVVQVTLANLLRQFDWELPQGQNANSIDMSCKGGLGNRKAAPLLAIPRKRNL